MTVVYATYRDMAELAPPGMFSVLLRVFDLSAVFVVGGASVLVLAGFCRRMHPRLGRDDKHSVVRVAVRSEAFRMSALFAALHKL